MKKLNLTSHSPSFILQMVETEVLPRSRGWYAMWPRNFFRDPKTLYSLTRPPKLTLLIRRMHNWFIISYDAQLPGTHGFEERFLSVNNWAKLPPSLPECMKGTNIDLYKSYLLYGQDLKGNEGREGRKAGRRLLWGDMRSCLARWQGDIPGQHPWEPSAAAFSFHPLHPRS